MIYIRLSYNNEVIEGIAIKTNNIIIIILKNSDFWRRREDAKSIKKWIVWIKISKLYKKIDSTDKNLRTIKNILKK